MGREFAGFGKGDHLFDGFVRPDHLFVIRRRDRLQVKRLQFLATKVRVMSDNAVYEPEEVGEGDPELELIGRVVWVGRKL